MPSVAPWAAPASGGVDLNIDFSADLVGHYFCNDNETDTDLLDASGAPVNNGVLNVNSDTLFQASGKINGALLFGGTVDQADITSVLNDVSSDTKGSIFAQVKPTAALQTGEIVSFGDTDANENLQFRINSDGKLRATLTVAGVTQWILESDNVIFTAGTYSSVGVTHNGTEATLYAGAVAIAATFTTDVSRTPWLAALTGVDNARIGVLSSNSTDSNFLKAEIDDVRIYSDRALPIPEILGIDNGGAGTESNSVDLTGVTGDFTTVSTLNGVVVQGS